jgi:hypothetical protein
MMNIFDAAEAQALIARIEALTPETAPLWGKMSVGQMLAHCSRPFDTIFDPQYTKDHPRPNALVRGLLRLFLKPIVVGPKPFKRNMPTAPEFIVSDARDVAAEQERLVGYVQRVQDMGAEAFEGKESHSFGPLAAPEWSMLFYKHTDHHLKQFGV